MFLNSEDHRDLSHLQLTPMQLKVLVDLHQILEVPHAAQEVLSTSRTPTLSMALPSYELLITAWRSTERKMPEMSHFINAGIQRLEKYIRLARKTWIYALAMSASHWSVVYSVMLMAAAFYSHQSNNEARVDGTTLGRG